MTGQQTGNGPGWTKGPWLMAAKPSSIVGWPIVAPQALGRVVCSLNYADPKAFGGRMPGDGTFNNESRANGCLIAAAPDLYEAGKDALGGWRYIRQHHGDLYGVGWDRVEQALTAALSKARGEQ